MYCQPRKFFCCCQSAVNVFTYSVGVKEITKSCSFKRQPLIPDPWKKFCEGHANKKVSGLISLMRDINSVPLFLSPEFVVISWRTPTGASDHTCPRNFAAEGTHIIRSFVMSDTRYNILKWQLIRSWMANRYIVGGNMCKLRNVLSMNCAAKVSFYKYWQFFRLHQKFNVKKKMLVPKFKARP